MPWQCPRPLHCGSPTYVSIWRLEQPSYPEHSCFATKSSAISTWNVALSSQERHRRRLQTKYNDEKREAKWKNMATNVKKGWNTRCILKTSFTVACSDNHLDDGSTQGDHMLTAAPGSRLTERSLTRKLEKRKESKNNQEKQKHKRNERNEKLKKLVKLKKLNVSTVMSTAKMEFFLATWPRLIRRLSLCTFSPKV